MNKNQVKNKLKQIKITKRDKNIMFGAIVFLLILIVISVPLRLKYHESIKFTEDCKDKCSDRVYDKIYINTTSNYLDEWQCLCSIHGIELTGVKLNVSN